MTKLAYAAPFDDLPALAALLPPEQTFEHGERSGVWRSTRDGHTYVSRWSGGRLASLPRVE